MTSVAIGIHYHNDTMTFDSQCVMTQPSFLASLNWDFAKNLVGFSLEIGFSPHTIPVYNQSTGSQNTKTGIHMSIYIYVVSTQTRA